MGISGLLPLLKSIQVKTHIKQYSGKTIGVDAYIWLYKGAFSCAWDLALGELTEKYVDYAMHRVRMLKHYGIKLFIVFDGGYLPSKEKTENQRGKRRAESKAKGLEFLSQNKKRLAMEQFQKCINVTPEMAYKFIKALRCENVDYVVAPYEADAQLAYLEKQGIIDAILTEDSDLLVFGCKCILLKLDQYGECIEIRREKFPQVKEIDLSGWSDENFRCMAILSGCDYLEGIPGVGLKTAYRLLKKHKTIDQLLRVIKLEYALKIPHDYEMQFNFANLTFMHQRVYCLDKKSIVMWNEPKTSLGDNIDRIAGPDIPADIVQGLISGEINPITRLPIFASLNEIQAFNKTKENIQSSNEYYMFSKQRKESSFNNHSIASFFASSTNNSRPQVLSVLNNNAKRLSTNDISRQTEVKHFKEAFQDKKHFISKINQENTHQTNYILNKINSSTHQKKANVHIIDEESQIKTAENTNNKEIDRKTVTIDLDNSHSSQFNSFQTSKSSECQILDECSWFNNVFSEKDNMHSKSQKIDIYEDKESYNNFISNWRQLHTHTSKDSSITHFPLFQIATQNTFLKHSLESTEECKISKGTSYVRKLPSCFKFSTNSTEKIGKKNILTLK
ncbi:hypothetical protein PNEG_03253 [Pneumocystis murina B123]|uniref:Uncharacterized protein n=1 Tax=Pneumocystis murina (strain B123) TaxID=1069680 RepID=M7NMH2_PNEMU|nr:hypothetical protein PNEG_03253 [Pneumocystis murina B123]EMR08417.1 hypothetical protein PNEG_03253 [Pneumocystis murina B123]